MKKVWAASFVASLLVGTSVLAQGKATASEPPTDHTSQRAGLQVYFIDVEGGQSTLFVAPDGESLLIDTGNPGGRDAQRIAEVCKLAGVEKIDNLLITHYHRDHVGGLPELVQMVPVGRFLDHGVNRESASRPGGDATVAGWDAYQQVLAKSHALHETVKPGDVLPVKAMHVEVVSADGQEIAKPLAAGGEQNPVCAKSPTKPLEDTENDRSVGVVMTYGMLRILDLGDLTWGEERPLMCPVDKLGKVDVYVVSHHGLDRSGSPALVDAIAPRIAIMDNGPHKGGAPTTFETIEGSPRLQDLWQLHTAEDADAKHNVEQSRIANLPGTDAANYLKLTARADGSISVMNSRTGETVNYPAQ